MKVLVCGQRDFTDMLYLFRVMDALHEKHKFDVVVEGEAPGADSLARHWAERRGVTVAPYPAKWKQYGKAAGPIRNREMMDKENPDLVVAFYNVKADSKGTRDMVRYSLECGKTVHEYENESPWYLIITPPLLAEMHKNMYNPEIVEFWSEYDRSDIKPDTGPSH